MYVLRLMTAQGECWACDAGAAMHVLSARSFKDWRSCLLWILNNAHYLDGIGIEHFSMELEEQFCDMRGKNR